MKHALIFGFILIFALGTIEILRPGLFGAMSTAVRRNVCSRIDGKWASVEDHCVTRSCYKQHSCGHWAFPRSRCSRLHMGDPISEVYFQLGETETVDGTAYRWGPGKGGGPEIIAQIDDGHLKLLNCEYKH